jgi:hypothetical protein
MGQPTDRNASQARSTSSQRPLRPCVENPSRSQTAEVFAELQVKR